MKMRGRMGQIARSLVLLGLVTTTVGWSTPATITFDPKNIESFAEPGPDLPGEPKLVNLSHVFAHDPGGARAKGTDVEFFTNEVPLRDEEGEKVLDEDGNEILVEKDFAVMGSYNRGAFVYDITDPENASLVRLVACVQTQNDVQIKQFGERWVLALARDGNDLPCTGISTGLMPSKGNSSGAGIAVFDITDPWEPVPMYRFRNTGGAHNFTFHPTKPFGWVSTGDLPGGLNHIPIINFTNLDNPTLAADPQVPGGPHDISFSPDGNRAYVASENNHRIYDTTNPGSPVLVSFTPNGGTYSHGLDPTPDGKIMVATNESLALGGFFVGGTAVCPGEGLTFYSIEGDREANPVPVGQYFANVAGRAPNRACTGHVGRIAPNSHVMVTGWYIGGVRVVDFANPAQPKEVASAVLEGTEVWAAKFYKGPYIYAADTLRGFDIYKWALKTAAPWEAP